MTADRTDNVVSRQPGLHDLWIARYRNADNERFMTMAFAYIADRLKANGRCTAGPAPPPETRTILDAGCGTGVQSIRLARHGFEVMAVDSSEYALGVADVNVKSLGEGVEQRISCST